MLRGLTARGMRAPALAIGEGALDFWSAAREGWPETREQRGWVHRIANVLDKLPTRRQLQAKRALHDMMDAKSRATCEATMQHVERQALEQQREPLPRSGPADDSRRWSVMGLRGAHRGIRSVTLKTVAGERRLARPRKRLKGISRRPLLLDGVATDTGRAGRRTPDHYQHAQAM